MRITDDDARAYRQELEAILYDHGLGWIVQQANERISIGKTASKRIEGTEIAKYEPLDDSEREDSTRAQRPGRRASEFFLATEPFSESEKLQIVLDALELSLVSPQKMQE